MGHDLLVVYVIFVFLSFYNKRAYMKVRLTFDWWLVLISSERKVLLVGWFVLREKDCWPMVDKLNEQGFIFNTYRFRI
jgi:hypothetical protein